MAPDGRRAPLPRPTRVLTVLIALACVLVAGVGVKISDRLDSGEVIRRTIIGRPAPFDGGSVSITKMVAGSAIDNGYSDQQLTTQGMFLSLTIKIEAPGQSVSVGAISGLELHTEDRVFRGFGNTRVTVNGGNLGTADLVFEVDPRHLDGAYVDLRNSEIFSVIPAVVRVNLGITDQNETDWAVSARGRTLHPADLEEKPLP